MRRAFVAIAWIAGTTVPLLLAGVFLVGCCVLPFHGLMHKAMPLCAPASDVLRGGHDDDHHHATDPSTPARAKEQPVRRLLSETPASFRMEVAVREARAVVPTAATAYRSFISLGAMRCDQDVGLHLFVASLLI